MSLLNRISIFVVLLAMLCPAYGYSSKPTLREKIGQMLILGFYGKTLVPKSLVAKAIDEDNIGGVILFDYNQQTHSFDKNISGLIQVRTLNQTLQKLNHESNKKHHRSDLPLLISIDYEGGKVNRLHPRYGFPNVPSAAQVGSMSSTQANKVAGLMARTLMQSGFNLDYYPVLDLNLNPHNPIIAKKDRSFSADPSLVSRYAQLFSDQLLGHGVICAYKHFPGHGSSDADSHLGFVDISNSWEESELIPYQEAFALKTHCPMVMVGHLVNRKIDPSGFPASLSYRTITSLLRNQLHFKGVVVTDDMQMKAITNHYGLETALTLSINAGSDMLIFGNQLFNQVQSSKHIIDLIEQKVRSGYISEKRIDEAYGHIVSLKKNFVQNQ